MLDVKALSDSLLATFKGYVERSVGAVAARLDAFERRLDTLPAPRDGRDGVDGSKGLDGRDGVDGRTPTAEELAALARDAVKEIAPEMIASEVMAGTSAESLRPVLAPLVSSEVAKAVEQIAVPVARDGVDGLPGRDGVDGHTPTAEELQPLIAAAVAEAAKTLPVPADGADGHTPTADELQPLVAAAVAEAVKAIPVPKDGRTPTADDLAPLVAAEVAKAVEAIPVPKDGHTPTSAELGPLVFAAVAEIAKTLPVPADGKDGHTPTAEELQPLVLSAVGKTLPETVAYEVARAIKELPAARDGEPGRDALDLHILPAINAEKAYPRGTYAKHLGGLWRSHEPTAGMRGWECIVDGIASLQVEQQGDRKFVVTMGLSSGAQQVKEFTLPVMIYRGVYREGVPYEAGDTVTWAGSTWTCKSATDAKPSEDASAWQLAVKKGRDGRSAEGVKT